MKSGANILQPSWITFDSITKRYTITAANPADVGVYTVTSIATIPEEDPATPGLNRVISYSFTLTVLHDCVNTVLTDMTISDMAIQVSQAVVTLDVSILDSIATT
jgi:hypothetical protein